MSISSRKASVGRTTLVPSREVGRRRVARLLDAAAEVMAERGYEGTTMQEVAARADTRIGSLYRFFPHKEALGDALAEQYAALLAGEYAALRDQAEGASVDELADLLLDQLIRLQPQTRAIVALLDSRCDWTAIRLGFREQALEGVAAALRARAPGLNVGLARDAAVVIFNNMKTMAAMADGRSATTPGASDQLRRMTRLYLEVILG